MRTRSLMSLVLGVLLVLGAIPAQAAKGGVVRFATLPADSPGHPEGIAADAAGDIYAATFSFAAQNLIHVFGRNGRLRTTIPLPTAPLFVVPLGLAFGPDGNLYAADFLNGDVLRFTPPFSDASTPAATFDVCAGVVVPPSNPAFCGLNAITFDAAGHLYVSDSFGGRIRRILLPAGFVEPTPFFEDERLKPGSHAFPGFGANGLAFNADGTALFIANTGDDRILKLDVTGTLPFPASALTRFAESLNGADGIAFTPDGLLWVAENQNDDIVALNDDGRIVDRRGSFEGIGPDGAARGLIFPASIVLSRGSIYVTNAALALTTDVTGDEPEEDVTTFTLSRIPLEGNP